MHGSDASGQRGSEETWPPDVWEAELTLAYSQQVQVARCWQKGVAVWKVAVGIFCFFWQVWSFGVFWSEDRKEKNQPSPGCTLQMSAGSSLSCGWILYYMPGILFHFLLTMCPQVQREAGSVCGVLWWHCQGGSTGNVMMHCGHDIEHLSFSLIWAK